MRNAPLVLALGLAVLLGSLASGCASGSRSTVNRPTDLNRSTVASRSIYLAQATCWNTISCCIQRFPTTAAQSCGASAVEIAEVLNGVKVLHETTKPEGVQFKEESQESETTDAEETAEAAREAAPEPPDCQGQKHHVISRPIARVLERHETLSGLYAPRDKRFIAKAKDKESHCGYQQWHRDVDIEVIQWLRDKRDATPKQFERFLRELYSRPEMRKRFPHGF